MTNKARHSVDVRIDKPDEKNQHLALPKKVLFYVMLIALPIVLIMLLEAGLRIFNYGGNTDLFVIDKSIAQPEYVLNKNFTKRYFFQKGIVTPTPLSQRFSAVKDSLTFRIFCLGASTVQGVPYPPNGAFPAQLENVLATLHPGRKIEVINCGITAIASYSVLDIAREVLAKYQPDLIVVYTGHNEFYGVLAQASRLSLFNSYFLIQSFLKLQHSKVFLLLRDVVTRLFSKRITAATVIHHDTMMGIMPGDVGISFRNKLFQRTESHFRKNLEAIAREAKNHHTNLLFCTLVSNVGDLRPLSSLHENRDRSAQCFELFMNAKELQSQGKIEEAVSDYQQALQYDSTDAEIQYDIGQAYRQVKNNRQANYHLQLARDFDTIRFRAPSSFNAIIKDVAQSYGVPIVDIEGAFRQVSPDSIVGKEYLLEHVHPNLLGYLLMAKTIAQKMSEEKMITSNWVWRRNLADSLYLQKTNLTLLDNEVANLTIFDITSHWPFVDNVPTRQYQRVGSEVTERLARQLISNKQMSLTQLHLILGKAYMDSNRTEEAIPEYRAALAIEPNCDIYNLIGPAYAKLAELAYRDEKDFDKAVRDYNEALRYFQQGLKKCPDHLPLNFNLGLLYALRNDKIDESLSCFEKVLQLDPMHLMAKRMIVHLYLRQNKLAQVEAFLLECIEQHPTDLEFQVQLGYVYSLEKKYADAEQWLQKALKQDPDNKLGQYILSLVQAKVQETQQSENKAPIAGEKTSSVAKNF
jgi:tetratricopeptide (TPR) repeat protein